MIKNLRVVAIICFLALTSNLVGNLVWTYVTQKDSVELATDEEDTDTDTDSDSNKSSKRSVNLLEEELHLTEGINTQFAQLFIVIDKPYFSIENAKLVVQDKKPLDNPPENNNVLS